jgi:hypothetical protein
MSHGRTQTKGETARPEVPEVKDVDAGVLRDLESRYSGVACPVHGGPPEFAVASDGSVVERFCCESLLRIIRELQAKEPVT